MILIANRHGLRASEVADLEWSQVEFGRAATLHVRRAKKRQACCASLTRRRGASAARAAPPIPGIGFRLHRSGAP
jgi:integrase